MKDNLNNKLERGSKEEDLYGIEPDTEEVNEEELKGVLDGLSYIEWLKSNIDKYEIGEWARVRGKLLGGNVIDNYETMEKSYNLFVSHFENNPYAYSSPIKENEGKITSPYPECYFVKKKINNPKKNAFQYVPLGFFEELKNTPEIRMSDKKLAEMVREFLEERKKEFWIRIYSKVERLYLNNYYDGYMDDWEIKGEGKKEKRKRGKADSLKIVLMIVLAVVVGIYYMVLIKAPIYDRNKIILLPFLAICIAEICAVGIFAFDKIKSRRYQKIIKKYETDGMYQKCCAEVEDKFSLWLQKPLNGSVSERLNIVMEKKYLLELDKKLKIKVGDGIMSTKACVVVFLAGLIIISFLYFKMTQ